MGTYSKNYLRILHNSISREWYRPSRIIVFTLTRNLFLLNASCHHSYGRETFSTAFTTMVTVSFPNRHPMTVGRERNLIAKPSITVSMDVVFHPHVLVPSGIVSVRIPRIQRAGPHRGTRSAVRQQHRLSVRLRRPKKGRQQNPR